MSQVPQLYIPFEGWVELSKPQGIEVTQRGEKCPDTDRTQIQVESILRQPVPLTLVFVIAMRIMWCMNIISSGLWFVVVSWAAMVCGLIALPCLYIPVYSR